jgi:hypothetical protein
LPAGLPPAPTTLGIEVHVMPSFDRENVEPLMTNTPRSSFHTIDVPPVVFVREVHAVPLAEVITRSVPSFDTATRIFRSGQ